MCNTKNSPTVFNNKKTQFFSKLKNPMVILFSHIGYKDRVRANQESINERADCFAMFFDKKVDDIVNNTVVDQGVYDRNYIYKIRYI